MKKKTKTKTNEKIYVFDMKIVCFFTVPLEI